MKYGINQWARISSLLVRKSAKQCKARWYEWLDPGIKKTEWTRDEDERLLHLGKLMPTQWRTIAPIVGRTPAQCLERYEKLLDAACVGEGAEGADDPRRLRPGEVDPNPESKPARPDAVDMEEDEKEMLSEARARLANTRGKKAKRKAREKQLEEARRLAALQKRRELKAAGIVSRGGGRRVMGIDYNSEVAFEKRAPAGFFDTAAEKAVEAAAAAAPFKPVTLAQLEGTRRRDIEEALMKRDAKRQKVLERHDAPAALAQAAQAGGEGSMRRSRLLLPAPLVTERELEALAAAGMGAWTGDDGAAATRALLPDPAATPAQPPLRTPRAPGGGGGDALLAEAANAARLQAGQTPLLGGANPELHPSLPSGMSRRAAAATPHPLAGGGTPRARDALALPGATPLRDGLRINDPDASVASGAREERARAAAARLELAAGLSALPAPRNEYQVVLPELPATEAEAAEVEDAADASTRLRAEAAAGAEAAARARSAAVQRSLPRPPSAPAPTSATGAEAALRAEIAAVVSHDAASPSPGPLLGFSPEQLEAAAAALREEVRSVRVAAGHEEADEADHAAAWAAARESARGPDTLPALRAAFAAILADMEKDARRAARLDARATALTGGYQRRAAEATARLDELCARVAARGAELHAFRFLHGRELAAAPARIERLAEEVAGFAHREAELQRTYRALMQAGK